MRVGVYIDGLNLYYGGRSMMGRGQPGWRWLDLRKLTQRLLTGRPAWLARGATLQRIVYCTAFIAGSYNAEGRRNQDRYIAALRQQGSFDVFEKGRFVSRLKTAPLATRGPGGKPVLTTSGWPVMVRDSEGNDVPDAVFMASHQHWEEKSTDVNVASHLLLDVVGGQVDAAIHHLERQRSSTPDSGEPAPCSRGYGQSQQRPAGRGSSGKALRRGWRALVVPTDGSRLLGLPATRPGRRTRPSRSTGRKNPAHKGPGGLVRNVTRKCQHAQRFREKCVRGPACAVPASAIVVKHTTRAVSNADTSATARCVRPLSPTGSGRILENPLEDRPLRGEAQTSAHALTWAFFGGGGRN